MFSLTLLTPPRPHIKGKAFDLIEASITNLRTRKEAAYLKVDFPFPFSFIFQHGAELTPTYLTYRLS